MNVAYPRVASRLFGHAHAIEPTALRAILDGPAAARILAAERPRRIVKVAVSDRLEVLANDLHAEPVAVNGELGEYLLTADGVAIIPVYGILSRRFDWLTAMCGWTTYQGLSATFKAVLADTRVNAILMDVDSPGGECGGLIDIANEIMAARATKHIWAVANDLAASAAYAIAGCAEKLILPALGQVGSIGAMMVHIDETKADVAAGLKYTAIHSGARKMDGWSHAELEPAALKALKARVDHCRDEFAALVGRQGRMSAKEATATEAAMYSDNDAVEARLADVVMPFEQALAEITELAAGEPQTKTTAKGAEAVNHGDRTMSKVQAKAKKAEIVDNDEEEDEEDDPPAGKKSKGKKAETAEPDDDEDDAPAGKKSKGKKAEGAEPDDNEDRDAPSGMKAKGKKSKAAEPDEDDPAEGAKTPAYTADMAAETMELCTLAGASLADARAFVQAKTPIAQVRSKLVAMKAKAGDDVAIDTTPAARPASATAGWDEAIAKVNALNGFTKRA